MTGGEPLLWPDFWPLYRELSGMGFQLSINSNGSLIDEAAIAAFTRQPPSRINITLYGASEDTYASLCRNGGGFRRTVAAIDGLRKAGIPVKLNCSLTPWNAGDLEAMVQFAQERELILEVNTYMFPPLRRDGDSVGVNQRFTPEDAAWWHLRRYQLLYGEERFQNLIRAAADGLAPPPGPDELCGDRCDGTVACRAGRASFWVTWDGWLTPCGMAPRAGLSAPCRFSFCPNALRIFIQNWYLLCIGIGQTISLRNTQSKGAHAYENQQLFRVL